MTRAFQPDPRQLACWENYVNPDSDTYSNAKASALKAGYSESHAEDIHNVEWFQSLLRKLRLKYKGEKVLEEMLDMPVMTAETRLNDLGEEIAVAVVKDTQLVKIKQDTAKFTVERLGKDEGWSTRSEITGAGGGPLVDLKMKEKSDEAINDFLSRPTGDTRFDSGDPV